MLKLYHSPRTRSARIIWLLEELGDVPYQLDTVDFSVPLDHIHHQKTPSGKFPTLEDDGLVLFESAAIIDHILYHYGRGRLMPEQGTADWSLYRQWCAFAEGGGGSGISVLLWYLYVEADIPGADKVQARLRGWVEDNLVAIEQGLKGQDYIVGSDFTAADIMLGYTLNMMKNGGVTFPDKVAAYFDRITARPAFQTAMA